MSQGDFIQRDYDKVLRVVPPTFWSDCSLRYLQNSFQRGSDLCLKNEPKKSLTAVKCGNGIVETGEVRF